MNYQELNFEISQLKQRLKASDYKAIKYAEGVISPEEYEPIKAERETWREQINAYEAELPKAKEEWERAMKEEGATE